MGDTANAFCHKLISAKAAPYNLSKAHFTTDVLSRFLSPRLSLSLTVWEDENLLDLATAQLWVASRAPHLLKIDVALTENISPSDTSHWSLIALLICVYVWWNLGAGKSPKFLSFPPHELMKMTWKRGFRLKKKQPLNHVWQKHWMWTWSFFVLFLWFFALLVVITKSLRCKLQSQSLTSTTGQ